MDRIDIFYLQIKINSFVLDSFPPGISNNLVKEEIETDYYNTHKENGYYSSNGRNVTINCIWYHTIPIILLTCTWSMNTQYSISKGNENTGCSSPECRSLVRLGEEGNLGNQKEAQLNPFWDYPNER